jgi:alanyl-tRNA synthetase
MGEASIALMAAAYPQLLERRELILVELAREETRFLETLDRGEKLLAELLAANPLRISGEQAFELYDTYGFPLELTEEIAAEHGLKVDLAGFEMAMQAQRERAKAAAVSIDLTLQAAIDQVVAGSAITSFNGYKQLNQTATVLALLVNGAVAQQANPGDQVQLILDATPFYGEGGGQVGDQGLLANSAVNVAINAVTRNRNVYVHSGLVDSGSLAVGDLVQAQVDVKLRRCAQANHTATHLLQAALKQLVDPAISQAGSLVDFDRLRFDFHSPRAITPSELDQIEVLINSWITAGHSLQVSEMPIQQAKAAGAVAMFGEKYGDLVRVVDVPGVSMELCGGTHVANSAELGVFKIISEAGVAAGVRRIEAVAGSALLPYLNQRDEVVKALTERFKVQPAEILERVGLLQEELRATAKALAAAREELALAKAATLLNQAQLVGDFQILVTRLDGVAADGLQTAAQQLQEQLGANAAVLLAGVAEPAKVALVAAFGPAVVKAGLQAGKFVGAVAKACGGGGGGRPNLAQAGGRDPGALPAALAAAKRDLLVSLKNNQKG